MRKSTVSLAEEQGLRCRPPHEQIAACPLNTAQRHTAGIASDNATYNASFDPIKPDKPVRDLPTPESDRGPPQTPLDHLCSTCSHRPLVRFRRPRAAVPWPDSSDSIRRILPNR